MSDGDDARPGIAVSNVAEEELPPGTEPVARSQWQLFRSRFFKHKLAVISLVVLVLLILACFGADVVAPFEKGKQDFLVGDQSPSIDHLFGTDALGRDQLTEILYAGQLSLKIGLAVAFVSTLLGTVLGALAGYFGKWIDNLISRITDLFLIVPALVILAVALSFVRERGTFLWWEMGDKFLWFRIQMDVPIIVIVAMLGWTYIARVVRGQVLSLKEKEFVEAARASGASSLRIIVRHILPNTVGVIMVNATLSIAAAIVAESTLTFLGFGVQLPLNSWGRMLYDAKGTVGTPKVYQLYFPGFMLLLTVLAVNFVGDGLRDAFDPQRQHDE